MSNNNILKNNNGSAIEAPNKNTQYFLIFNDEVLDEQWCETNSDYHKLLFSNVFLTKREAERALEMMQVKQRLTKKIKEIDRENGWVADWNYNAQDKYIVSFNYDLNYDSNKKSYKKDFGAYQSRRSKEIYMSKEAKDYMMSDEVSLRDFKLFLGMIGDDEKDMKRAEYMSLHYELIAIANEFKKRAEEL